MSEIKPKARQSEIVVQEFGEEILIYDLRANKAFALNTTCSKIWQHCNGKNTVGEIAEKMSVEVKEFVSEDLVWLALEKLKKGKLLEDNGKIFNFFEGKSRRELIKKAGLTTVVAFPIISSLVAPTSVQAALSACPSAPCRCPNASVSCNGSTATVGGVMYVNCLTNSGGNSNCNCIGPFNANDSAGAGFKSSTVGCSFP